MADIFGRLSETVIFLFAGNPPTPAGTAFIVAYPLPGRAGLSVPLVVTAKHVVGDASKLYARFSTQSGASTAFVEYDLIHLRGSKDYWEHPDQGVDLAVFRSLHFAATKYEALPIDLVAARGTFQTEGITQTDRIIFPALLVNFIGSARNYPVMRGGTIAQVPEERVPLEYNVGTRRITTQQEIILLDATSVPGASGSPVFLWPGPRIKDGAFTVGGNKPYLLGVMHGFYPAVPRELVTQQTARQTQMYAENSGIAIVFPSWRLVEIFELPALRARIAEVANSGSGPSGAA